jgi:hypothetical protein
MAMAALDGGHATNSRRSKRVAICGIVFGCATMTTTRNRAMAVELEEEGEGRGNKSNGNCNKVDDCKQQ